MATKYFTGSATPVAQVNTITSVGGGATDYASILINGVIIADYTAVGGDGDDEIAQALVVAWNASTHVYATGITAADTTGAVAGTLSLTADTAGLPFTVSLFYGGAGYSMTNTAVTANDGPNVVDSDNNWDGGAKPANGDVLILANSNTNICWGLSALAAVTPADIYMCASFTGRIGLNRMAFATSADATTTNSSYEEYRPAHWQILCSGKVHIGYADGTGIQYGSSRVMMNLGATATEVHVWKTAGSSADDPRPAVRLLANNAATDGYVVSAAGGVGIAADLIESETSSIRTLSVRDLTGNSTVMTGSGTTLTNFKQMSAGSALIDAAAAVTLIEQQGGTVRTQGDWVCTTLKVGGGTCYPMHRNAAACIGTVTHNGGTIDASEAGETRTWTTYNPAVGAVLHTDSDVLTITNLNEPSGRYRVQYAAT